MKEIIPSVDKWDILCAETRAGPNGFVVFGASGDLANRKLLVSICHLYTQDLLDDKFYLLGCGRTKFTDEQFRKRVEQSIRDNCDFLTPKELDVFLNKLYYVDGHYDDIDLYRKITLKLVELDKKYKIEQSRIFYLSVPPELYTTIIENLGLAGLTCPENPAHRKQIKLVVEKPFGRDYASAVELNNKIHQCFHEFQIYRIDHYLGKETVQNILMLRFANTIFEPVWNRNYIDNVQITISETVGVEHRAGYYDNAGALRDIFQNHMLQMLALVAMEPPISFDAEYVRNERAKLLRSIRSFDIEKLDDLCVRGQYGPGKLNGKKVNGYLQEEGVKPNSRTETYVAAKLFIDNWRWQGVPFYIRTGKMLAAKLTEIAITFKKVPYSLFSSVGLDELPANVLVLKIQPEEGISLSFQAKRPGSKICMSTLDMNFSYKSVFMVEMPEAYQRLLLDCMIGDQTLFTRQDDIEVSWKLLTPILQAWEQERSDLYTYPAGSDSFEQTDKLIQKDGCRWRKLNNT